MKRTIALVLVAACCLLICGCGGVSQLSAPQNLHIEDRALVWDAVRGAEGYVVFSEGTEFETQACRYDLSALTVPDTYEIEVMAMGDGSHRLDSLWASFYYTVPGTGSEDKEEPVAKTEYDQNGFALKLLPDGTGYELSAGRASRKEKLELPDSFNGLPVVSIAERAFYVSWNFVDTTINEIKFPSELKSIGGSAFPQLAAMQSVTIPDTVTELGESAFYGCFNLRRVVLPDTLKKIPADCFASCAVEEIVFPSRLEEIGASAFSAIDSWVEYGKTTGPLFQAISFPETLQKIGRGAFSGCSALKEVTLPPNLQQLEANAFFGTPWYEAQAEGLVTIGEFLYCYKGTADAAVSLPASCKKIAGGAFEGQKNLQTVTIPNGVKLCGSDIFMQCSSLSMVALPLDLEMIPSGTFSGCRALTNIFIPKTVTSIGSAAFLSCSSLEGISLPQSLDRIEYNTFYGCTALCEITLPQSIRTIDDDAFYESGLKKIVLPVGVTTIGAGAFYRCEIEEIALPPLTSIGLWAFSGCPLREIILPASVKELGREPFAECENLERVFYEGGKRQLDALVAESNAPILSQEGEPVFSFYPFANAAIYYYSEAKPLAQGFWHYVDGAPALW